MRNARHRIYAPLFVLGTLIISTSFAWACSPIQGSTWFSDGGRSAPLDPIPPISPADPNPGGEVSIHFTGAAPNTFYHVALVDSASSPPGIQALSDDQDPASNMFFSDDTGTIDAFIKVPFFITLGVVIVYAYQQLNPSSATAPHQMQAQTNTQKQCLPPYPGGLQRDFQVLPEHLQGCERHHTPAQKSYPNGWKYNGLDLKLVCRPVVIMTRPDHMNTLSWGSGPGPENYRLAQRALLGSAQPPGSIVAAFEKDRQDISDVRLQGKYIQALDQDRAAIDQRFESCLRGSSSPSAAGGLLSKSGASGTVITAYATTARPNKNYQLVAGTSLQPGHESHACMEASEPLNPAVRISNARGFIPNTTGAVNRTPGEWQICFGQTPLNTSLSGTNPVFFTVI